MQESSYDKQRNTDNAIRCVRNYDDHGAKDAQLIQPHAQIVGVSATDFLIIGYDPSYTFHGSW